MSRTGRQQEVRSRLQTALTCGLLLCSVALSAADGPLVEASEPRAYGYQVGDHVQRQVSVFAPDGWTLDPGSVPRAGGRGRSIELHAVHVSSQRENGGQRHRIDLDYQVFLAPAQVRTLEIPSFRLRLVGAGRSEAPLVEAWPVTVAPLVPAEPSPRRGLGDMQPDRPPPLIDTTPMRTRLLACAGLASLLLAGLALAYLGPPWRAARNRPFGLAWRQLRRLPARPDPAQWQAACRQLHEALNRCGGEVLFESGLPRFVAARPAFAALQADLMRFLQLTRQEFFAGSPYDPANAAWLVGLCRRCHAAERE